MSLCLSCLPYVHLARCPSTDPSVYAPACRSVCRSVITSIFLSVCRSVQHLQSNCLSVLPSVYPTACQSVCRSVLTSIHLSMCLLVCTSILPKHFVVHIVIAERDSHTFPCISVMAVDPAHMAALSSPRSRSPRRSPQITTYPTLRSAVIEWEPDQRITQISIQYLQRTSIGSQHDAVGTEELFEFCPEQRLTTVKEPEPAVHSEPTRRSPIKNPERTSIQQHQPLIEPVVPVMTPLEYKSRGRVIMSRFFHALVTLPRNKEDAASSGAGHSDSAAALMSQSIFAPPVESAESPESAIPSESSESPELVESVGLNTDEKRWGIGYIPDPHVVWHTRRHAHEADEMQVPQGW